jgi:hypothetical protein
MRRVSVFITVLCLEAYAFLLALLQMPGGVRTDEAKYLLSIPYPHPPLARFFMSMTSALPGHEFLWRFIIATIVVQAVWLLVDLGEVLTPRRRMLLAGVWLFSSAVVIQGGTIVLAVLTAVYGLLFLWLALHPKPVLTPATIGCLWLASLFTAYQSILFAPLVLSTLLHKHVSKRRIAMVFVVPIVLLAMYTLINPHALLSMVQVSGQDSTMQLIDRLSRIGWVWVLAGSGIVSLVGTVGILTSSRYDLVAAFGLVLGYIVLTSQHYYAILLTPLLAGGIYLLLCKRRLAPTFFFILMVPCTLLVAWKERPAMEPTLARPVIQQLASQGLLADVLLIDGPFGHEWQYESPVPVRRFSQELKGSVEAQAKAIICTKTACEEDISTDEWERVQGFPVEVWVRR